MAPKDVYEHIIKAVQTEGLRAELVGSNQMNLLKLLWCKTTKILF